MQTKEFKKIIIVISVLLVLLVGLFTLRWQRRRVLEKKMRELTSSQLKVKPPIIISTKVEEALSGVYKIVFKKENIKVGETVSAHIVFTADKKIISGSDVILRFNPTFLSADLNIKLGDYFASYPLKSVDNEKGTIKVTAFSGKNKPVSSSITLFTVSFTAKRAGKTTVDFDFQKGRTNLTTLVEKGTSKNILGQIIDGTVTIEP